MIKPYPTSVTFTTDNVKIKSLLSSSIKEELPETNSYTEESEE